MKNLILFELGKKRYYMEFDSYASAVEEINHCTRLADATILSITEIQKNVFEIIFSDETPAKISIVESESAPLGYFACDLRMIFARLDDILRNRKLREESDIAMKQYKARKHKKELRSNAIGIILAGFSVILLGFALAAFILEPLGQIFQYSIFGFMVLIGLAITIRGSYQFINPFKVKRNKNVRRTA